MWLGNTGVENNLREPWTWEGWVRKKTKDIIRRILMIIINWPQILSKT